MALVQVAGTLSGAVVEDTQLTAFGAAYLQGDAPVGAFLAGASVGLYGTFTVQASGDWSYALNNTGVAVQGLAANEQAHELFVVTWSNGAGGFVQGVVDVNVTGTNDPASFSGELVKKLDVTLADSLAGQIDAQDSDVGEKGFQAMADVAGTVGLFSIDKNGAWRYELLPGQQTAISDQDKAIIETFDVVSSDGSVAQVSVLVTTDETTPPVITGFSPADEGFGVAVGADIVITFDEPIQRGAGTIVLKTAGVVVATYDAATSTNLSLDGTTLTIDPIANLGWSTAYKVELAAGAILDLAGNAHAGTTSYNFTTMARPDQNLVGNAADETFTSGAGNDTFNGAGGVDTAVFSGSLAGYTVTRSGAFYTVVDNLGTDGSDTVTNIEALQFADKTVNLTVQAKAAAIPEADVERLAELYVAFFNRVPDANGMAYWIGQLAGGQPLNQIADAFYNAGVLYASLTGFSADMTNAAFVNVIYRNVLGRSDGGDAQGVAYWAGELASGHATRGSLVSAMLTSAHSFKGDATWGWVADLLDNKLEVANQIAIQWGLNYNTPGESISQGMAIAAAVTPDGTEVALALIGVTDANLQLG